MMPCCAICREQHTTEWHEQNIPWASLEATKGSRRRVSRAELDSVCVELYGEDVAPSKAGLSIVPPACRRNDDSDPGRAVSDSRARHECSVAGFPTAEEWLLEHGVDPDDYTK